MTAIASLRRALLAGAVLLLLAGCNTQLLTTSDLMDVDSTQMVDPTGNFSPPGSWDLKYGYDCSKQQSEGIPDANRFDMIVYNSDDGSTNAEHPELHLTGKAKRQTLHFVRGGTFYISIDSKCDWRLSVVDTSGAH